MWLACGTWQDRARGVVVVVAMTGVVGCGSSDDGRGLSTESPQARTGAGSAPVAQSPGQIPSGGPVGRDRPVKSARAEQFRTSRQSLSNSIVDC